MLFYLAEASEPTSAQLTRPLECLRSVVGRRHDSAYGVSSDVVGLHVVRPQSRQRKPISTLNKFTACYRAGDFQFQDGEALLLTRSRPTVGRGRDDGIG